MEEVDFRELGIKMGHRKKILRLMESYHVSDETLSNNTTERNQLRPQSPPLATRAKSKGLSKCASSSSLSWNMLSRRTPSRTLEDAKLVYEENNNNNNNKRILDSGKIESRSNDDKQEAEDDVDDADDLDRLITHLSELTAVEAISESEEIDIDSYIALVARQFGGNE